MKVARKYELPVSTRITLKLNAIFYWPAGTRYAIDDPHPHPLNNAPPAQSSSRQCSRQRASSMERSDMLDASIGKGGLLFAGRPAGVLGTISIRREIINMIVGTMTWLRHRSLLACSEGLPKRDSRPGLRPIRACEECVGSTYSAAFWTCSMRRIQRTSTRADPCPAPYIID